MGIIMDIGAPLDPYSGPNREYTPIFNKMNTDMPFGDDLSLYQ